MPCRVVLLTFWAAPDKVDDSCVHFWLPEVSLDKFDRLILAHVSCDFHVVFRFENQIFEISILRDPEHTHSVE